MDFSFKSYNCFNKTGKEKDRKTLWYRLVRKTGTKGYSGSRAIFGGPLVPVAATNRYQCTFGTGLCHQPVPKVKKTLKPTRDLAILGQIRRRTDAASGLLIADETPSGCRRRDSLSLSPASPLCRRLRLHLGAPPAPCASTSVRRRPPAPPPRRRPPAPPPARPRP